MPGGPAAPPHLPVAPRSTAARAGNPTHYDAVVAAVGYDLNRSIITTIIK